jgi:hypothetical protein
MADYRKLSIDLITTNGIISENEVKILKKNLFNDEKISDSEVLYLQELKAAVNRKTKDPTPVFDKFILKCLTEKFLKDGAISAEEVALIKKMVIGDKKMDVSEIKKFLDKLNKETITKDPEFVKVYDAFVKKLNA